ncbi:MAG TPA: hypothetical protein VLA37_09735 [Sphingomonadaceae bacterium]|nr:hypothetical protein [Sphingomonadaceae bacterium]
MLAALHDLRFASDATLAAIWGGAFLLLALVALVAEVRRTRRKQADRVGCMPWTAIFFIAAMLGVTLITMAFKGWSAGGG